MMVSKGAIANTATDVRLLMPAWHTGDMVTLDGQVIKKARQARKWTQYDLADELGVSQPTIQRWEAGKREPDSLADFVNLCGKLSISADELLGLQNKAAPAPPRPEQLSEDTWTALLAFAFDADMEDRVQLERIRIAADIVRHGLGLIEEDQDFERNPKMLVAALKRFAATRHADTRQSPPA